MEHDKKYKIGMDQIRYIASLGKCPACGSQKVRFKLPFECHILANEGKLDKVVLDFSNPDYWLKNTMTTCDYCGFQFHLRDLDPQFYKGLNDSMKQDEFKDPLDRWYYEFESFKTFEEEEA